MATATSLALRARPILRDRSAWAGAGWFVSGAVAALSAVLGAGWPLVVALLVNYVCDYLLYDDVEGRLTGWLGRRELGAVDRALFREAVAIIGWAQQSPGQAVLTGWAIAVALAVQATHAGYRLVTRSHLRARGGRIAWRGLDVNGQLEGPQVLAPTLYSPGNLTGPRVVLLLDVFLVLGLALAGVTGRPLWLVVGAVLTTLGLLWVGARLVARTRLIRSLPTPQEENAALRAALAAHRPEVAVYFSGGPDTTYQLNVWLETIDRLHQPAVIILRERRHLDDMLPTTTPTIVLPRARDVEDYQPDSVRVVLYPTTVIKNNHMIRLGGVRHVFINHGDGDKSVTFSPLHRVFDEIWVAGSAACDRYLTKGEGVRPEQLVQVGRPQLAHIARRGEADPGARRTVLYAPTWEGNFDGVDYSSVAPMGELILDTLLDPALNVRVLFKAHPATGTRLPAAAAARANIERRIEQAGGEHAVVGSEPDSLYRAFNDADVLISDISSVVADFLASRKPYLITNPRGVPEETFHQDFPSTTGGAIVTPDRESVRAAVADAIGADPLRGRREELATYFLGAPVDDPVERFAAEVDAAIGRAPAPNERVHDDEGAVEDRDDLRDDVRDDVREDERDSRDDRRDDDRRQDDRGHDQHEHEDQNDT